MRLKNTIKKSHNIKMMVSEWACMDYASKIAMMCIQMLRKEFILIEDFVANLTRKRFCDDAVNGSSMPFQISLVCISSITVFFDAFIRLFSCMNLKIWRKYYYFHNICMAD